MAAVEVWCRLVYVRSYSQGERARALSRDGVGLSVLCRALLEMTERCR
jgi:hypothetical protein